MSEPIFSGAWYRVADLRPRLRSHARIHRHKYRGNTWFVLQDFSTGRFLRFTPAAYRVIGLMDGQRSVDEIWRLACERLGDDAPTQNGLIRLITQLHQADALQSNVPPDTAELLERHERQQRGNWIKRLLSPFAVQIPLFDPERFLSRTVHLVRPLVGWLGVSIWLACVLPAMVLVVTHFAELSEGVIDRILAPQNLVLLWLLFPVIKAFHEFGHAYAAKALGAEIHDMGIILLVFTPIPYVEASSASAFSKSAHRVAVSSGGMIVEVFLAAIATYVWVSVEPGVVRTLAFNAMVIGGVTTLAFNANPLLRFDGYYVLSDLLEIPNLRARSNAYIGYLVERYVMRRPEAEAPDASRGERGWLASYAIASFLYRIVITIAIAMLVLDWSLPLGVLLLGISAISWIGMPAVRGIRFLARSPRLQEFRGRAIGITAGGVLAVLLGLTVLPVPLRTLAEGVIWIPDEAHVRAAGDGYVGRVVAEPGSEVESGDVLIETHDPELHARIRELEARVRELDALYAERRPDDVAASQIIEEERRYAQGSLQRARERADEATIRSLTSGTFVAPLARDLPGRFVRKGEVLAQVVDLKRILVRAVVAQDDISLMRDRLRGVDVRLAEDVGEVLAASVRRVVPAASERLPSSALGSEGGGEIAIDPRERDGVSALEPLFEVELELPADSGVVNVGGRVYIRFDMGSEPPMSQWYRRLRQLFLARFDV